jgi:large subunit ribosomal protein L6
MSRVGKKPIPIPKEIHIDIKGDLLTVTGPKGELSRRVHPRVHIRSENNEITVTVNDTSKESRSLHGLHRALIANMVTGVSQGFERGLEIVGVGYRADLSGKKTTFHLGYSNPIEFQLPDTIEATVEKTRITLRGIDKELLGATAAKIRALRSPEPYKGKGIRYVEEMVRRKAGKTAGK